jgi:hypothetical protein
VGFSGISPVFAMLKHLILSFALASSVLAAPQPGWFSFALKPGLDGAPCRGEIDLTRLNEAPAGKNGFVSVKGEQFVDGKGTELRFFGTNVVATSLFPQKSDAPRFAAHLASVGHNIVRCHFLDNMWGGDSLLQKPDYKSWNLEALDRFHFYCAELKQRGIYVNLNLHVGRVYEGTPKGAPDFSKGLDLFYSPYITAFQEYARFLLTTKNPYTGLAPAEDPAVACVELNNENTLLMNPWWLHTLEGPQKAELLQRWTVFLKKQYGTDAALEAKYGRNEGKLGAELGKAFALAGKESPWQLESPMKGSAELSPLPEGGVRWNVKQVGEKMWDHQYSFGQPALPTGRQLLLKFKAKASEARKLIVSFMHHEAPWKNCGLADSVELSTEWQSYALEFTVMNPAEKKTRVAFNANNKLGFVDLKDFSLQEASGGYLAPGETLAAGTVPLPKRSGVATVREDFFKFLAETEISWAAEAKAFVKEKLGVKVPVAHSHVLFGGLMGSRREAAVGDFVDNHGYWQHPHFPNKPWDMNDWEIPNTSQLLSPDGGTLCEMAMQRPVGKPYTISEYDVPAPSDYAAELWPMVTAVASEQGWAGLYSYCWANDIKALEGGKIAGFFDQCGHPAKEGFLPTAALIYRLGMIKPHLHSQTLQLPDAPLMEDMVDSNADLWGSWRRLWKDKTPMLRPASHARVGVATGSAAKEIAVLEAPSKAAAQQTGWSPPDQAPRYTAVGDSFVMVTGKLSQQEQTLADVRLKFGELPGNGHATVSLVSLDAAPFTKATRVLITALRQAENENMGWENERQTVRKKWGVGPTQVLGITAEMQLPVGFQKVYKLDARGNKAGEVAVQDNKIQLTTELGTIWLLAER